MKFQVSLLLFALVGFAAASDPLDDAVDEVVKSFKDGLDSAPVVWRAEPAADDAAEETKNQLVDALKEALKDTVEKIKVRVDEKHQQAKDLVEKATELAARLKQLRENAMGQLKDSLETIKSKATERVQAIIDKLVGGGREKRGIEDSPVVQDFLLKSLLDHIKSKVTNSAWQQIAKRLFGQEDGKEVEETMLQKLGRKGREALVKVLDRIMEKQTPSPAREKRQVGELTESVRNFLKEIGVNFRERYADFAEWLRNSFQQGLAQAKDKHAQLKEIAKEVTAHAKEMHKETVREAVEVLRPFKDELGNMWTELLEAAKKSLNRKDNF